MKLTEKHLKVFKQATAKWQTQLGLIGWHITVEWEKSDDDSALAITRLNVKSHIAYITLVRTWPNDEDSSPEHMEELAFHELLHVLLGDLTYIGDNHAPSVIRETLAGIEHNVIRTLENLVFRILK